MRYWSFDSGARLWRIAFEGSFLIAEVRDPERKTAHLVALEAETGQLRWRWQNPEEPWWLGLEAVGENLVLVHGYADPRLPEHRGLIALELETGRERWRSAAHSLLFWHPEQGLCAYRRQGLELLYELLDPASGRLRRALGSDRRLVEALRPEAKPPVSHQDVCFPEPVLQAPFLLEADPGHLEALSWGRWWIGVAFRADRGTWLEVWDGPHGRRLWSDQISHEVRAPESDACLLRRGRLYYAQNRRVLFCLVLE